MSENRLTDEEMNNMTLAEARKSLEAAWASLDYIMLLRDNAQERIKLLENLIFRFFENS